MPCTKSTSFKHVNSNYQSLYLWTCFLWGMISLGIVIWNRRWVVPAQVGIQQNNLSRHREMPRIAWNESFISTYPINFPSFASLFALNVLAYQLSGNALVGLLSSYHLFFATPAAGQYSKLQTTIPEFRVNTYIPGGQLIPVVSRIGNGFIIAWNSAGQDGSGYGGYAQRYTNDGIKDGGEFRINNFTMGDQGRAWTAGLSDNNFVIVWHSFNQDGDDYGIYGRIYASNGSVVCDEFRVNMFTPSQQIYPKVFASRQNEFLVLWNSGNQDGSSYGVYGRYYFNNGVPITDEFRINMYTNDDQSESFAAAIRGNRWIIAWHSKGQDGSSYEIYANIFTNHTIPLGPEFRVNQYIQNAQLAPVILYFQSESIILYISQGSENVTDDISNFAVYGRRFSDNGVAMGDEFRISFWSLSQAHEVSGAILNQDYFVVTWKAYGESVATNFDIYGRICHREGNCISSEFRINSNYPCYADYTGGEVVALSNHSFVVTYDGGGHDPDGSDGVYARIITLSDLHITLPTQTVATVVTTTSAISTSTATLNTQEISQSTVINLTESASTETSVNANNIGVLAGGIAGAFAAGVLISAAGFFAVNKCRKSSADSNKNEVALQNRSAPAQPSSRNYGEIDATKQNSQQYDRPVELKI